MAEESKHPDATGRVEVPPVQALVFVVLAIDHLTGVSDIAVKCGDAAPVTQALAIDHLHKLLDA
ncbi:MAG: hypothetical protein ACI9K5_003062 [Gammaproteobacteria bacterium]